jgi:hypothetical protein
MGSKLGEVRRAESKRWQAVCAVSATVRIYGLTSNVWSSRDTPKLLQLSFCTTSSGFQRSMLLCYSQSEAQKHGLNTPILMKSPGRGIAAVVASEKHIVGRSSTYNVLQTDTPLSFPLADVHSGQIAAKSNIL